MSLKQNKARDVEFAKRGFTFHTNVAECQDFIEHSTHQQIDNECSSSKQVELREAGYQVEIARPAYDINGRPLRDMVAVYIKIK